MRSAVYQGVFLLPAFLALAACSHGAETGRAISAGMTGPPPSADQAVAAPKTYSDPFVYCAAIGQIDAPDARFVGAKMTDALFKDYLKAAGLDVDGSYPMAFQLNTLWRCMDHRVYACNYGANIPCDSKADSNRTPTQATIDYCAQFPDSSIIPMSVTGHAGIYSWHCIRNVPEILGQIDTVDAAGYPSRFWQLIEPVF